MRAVPLLSLLMCVLLAGCDALLPEPFVYGTVEVEAVRRNGDPVAGVDLVLFSGQKHLGYGTTNAEGRHVFGFVPAGRVGVFAQAPDGYRLLDERDGFIATRAVDEGSRDTVSFTLLKEGDGSVVVRVVDASGAAVPGVRVQLYTGRGVFAEGTTDAAGEHGFVRVPLDRYGVIAVAGPVYVAADEGPLALQEGLLIDEGHEERVRFVFRRCEGRIVVNVREPAGAPVPGATLQLYAPGGTVAEVRATDGRHEFGPIPCGAYGVRVAAPLGYRVVEGRGTSFFDGLTVRVGSSHAVEFTLARCAGRIRARVVDQTGAAVQGALLTLYSTQGVIGSARTGADGAHLFADAPCIDGYGLQVQPPAGYRVTEGRGSSYFDGIVLGNGGDLAYEFRVTRL